MSIHNLQRSLLKLSSFISNPAIKEKMALDVEVWKLKLLKANFVSNHYRLKDDIAKDFPQQIAILKESI